MMRSARPPARPLVVVVVLLAVVALALGCSPHGPAGQGQASLDLAAATPASACAADLRAEGTLYWSACG